VGYKPTTVFKTAALNRSAISPNEARIIRDFPSKRKPHLSNS